MSHRRRNDGMWYADDFMLPYDGTEDISNELTEIFTNRMVPGDSFVFRPDGKYLANNQVLMSGLSYLNIYGQNAHIFGTVERNNKFFYVLNCHEIEFRDLHIHGYSDFESLGSQLEVGVGSPTVSGSTMLLDSQNESVFVNRATAGGWGYPLGRDQDGYCRIKLRLSDTNHVANDCQIVVTNSFGTVLETITIPVLTSTPTDYLIRHKLLDPRDRLDWEIKKSTATANTIVVSYCFTISPGAYNSLIFNNAGWDFTATKGFRMFNCSAEGVGGDALQSSSSSTFTLDAVIRGFVSRCCGRQGVSFNNNKSLRFEDFDIYFSGRSGIDIEPESLGALCNDVTIGNGRIWSPVNSGIACTGWSWINRMELHDIEMYDCGRAAVEGGSRGGKWHGISNTVIRRLDASGTQGAIWPDFFVTGQNMKLWDINADRGFFFQNDSGRTDEAGVPVYAGGYQLGAHTIARQSDYGGIACQPGVSVTVIGGSGSNNVPVPVWGRGNAYGGVGPAGGVRRFSVLDVEIHQDRLPASYGGGMASSHLWSPGGHDFVGEPLIRAGAIGAQTTAFTLQSSTARASSGVTTAVDAGEATVARFRLLVTAILGTLPVLNVDVQHSHDNVNFTTIDSFPTVAATTSSEYSKLIEFRNTARYLRLSYTVAGTGASFTFSVIGDVTVAGNNLRALNASVPASAPALAVTFPTRVYANPSALTFSGSTLFTGSLSAGTTYYYRIAGRPLLGGPIIPLAEQSFTVIAGQSVIVLNVAGMENLTAGIQIAGLTIYRGTTPGVYTARYDLLPRTRMYSIAAGAAVQQIVDAGPFATVVVPFPISQVTLGYPATIPARTGTFTPVDETGWELDANYDVWVTTNWNSGFPYIAAGSKTRSGYTINFPSPAPGDGSGRVSAQVMR